MVSSEMIISKNAEKVEKTPNFSGSKPNPIDIAERLSHQLGNWSLPAAAEKFARSMIPDGRKTSGCLI